MGTKVGSLIDQYSLDLKLKGGSLMKEMDKFLEKLEDDLGLKHSNTDNMSKEQVADKIDKYKNEIQLLESEEQVREIEEQIRS